MKRLQKKKNVKVKKEEWVTIQQNQTKLLNVSYCYVQDDEGEFSIIEPFNPKEQQSCGNKSNQFYSFSQLEFVKQEDNFSYELPKPLQFKFKNCQDQNSINSTESETQKYHTAIKSHIQYKPKPGLNFVQHCQSIQKNDYTFVPIQKFQQINNESRTRLPTLKYWCQQTVMQHGKIIGIMTKNYK